MRFFIVVICASVVWGVGVFLFIFTFAVRAQEQDTTYPQTREWTIETQRTWPNIHVVDTAGVCLYMADTVSSPIAAVPKTALAPGKGCQ